MVQRTKENTSNLEEKQERRTIYSDMFKTIGEESRRTQRRNQQVWPLANDHWMEYFVLHRPNEWYDFYSRTDEVLVPSNWVSRLEESNALNEQFQVRISMRRDIHVALDYSTCEKNLKNLQRKIEHVRSMCLCTDISVKLRKLIVKLYTVQALCIKCDRMFFINVSLNIKHVGYGSVSISSISRKSIFFFLSNL